MPLTPGQMKLLTELILRSDFDEKYKADAANYLQRNSGEIPQIDMKVRIAMMPEGRRLLVEQSFDNITTVFKSTVGKAAEILGEISEEEFQTLIENDIKELGL